MSKTLYFFMLMTIYLLAITVVVVIVSSIYGCDIKCRSDPPELSNADDGAYRDTTNGPNMPASFFTNCRRLERQGSGWTEAEEQACNEYGYYLVPHDVPDPGPMVGKWMADAPPAPTTSSGQCFVDNERRVKCCGAYQFPPCPKDMGTLRFALPPQLSGNCHLDGPLLECYSENPC